MTSTLSVPFGIPSTPFYRGSGGGATSALVPDVFDVSIGGIPFLIDTTQGRGVVYRSIPLLRRSVDQSQTPSERSLNPQGLWRRSFNTWHLGTGQSEADRPDSLEGRSNASKGVDTWTKWTLSLLDATTIAAASVNTNLAVVAAGSRLYYADGQTLKYTTDPYAGTITWVTVTGTAAANITGLATDGYHVFVAQGASGLYITNTSVSTAASWKTGQADDVDYALSRVMVSSANSIFNVTDSYTAAASALASPLMAHANTSWKWVGHASGVGFIYSAGYVGDASVIYRTTIAADASALSTPIVAGVLPDGEVVTSIYAYLGFVLIGTTTGVRMATSGTSGDLTIGELLDTGSPVRGFEGQGRYVWFTWEGFDLVDGGLGRLDLVNFIGPNTPAYASDLMVASTGNIGTPVTFGAKRVFVAQGTGMVAQGTDKVASGWLTTGTFRYGIADNKTILDILANVIIDAVGASADIYLSEQGATFTLLYSATATGSVTASAGESTGAYHEFKVVLNASAATPSAGASMSVVTAEGYPRTEGTMLIDASVLLVERVTPPRGGEYVVDVADVWNSLRTWWTTREILSWQDLQQRESVMIDDLVFDGTGVDQGRTGREGTVTVRMKVI